MSQGHYEDNEYHLRVSSRSSYQSKKVNKGIVLAGSKRTLKESGHPEYMEASVNKLR